MTYRIEFKKSVTKDLKKIDKLKVKLILKEIEVLKNGIDNNENIIKMKGNNSYYRLRIGDYRVIFELNNDVLVIVVVKVGHRKEVYKRF